MCEVDPESGGTDGFQFLELLKRSKPDVPVIVMSAYGSVDLAIEAMQAGAYDYVAKPFKVDDVKDALKAVGVRAAFLNSSLDRAAQAEASCAVRRRPHRSTS